MPKEIVTEIKHIETCPAPESNLSGKDVEQFVEELEQYTGLFKSAFDRREQWEKSQIYVKGLLGNTARKTVERRALEMGEKIRALCSIFRVKALGKRSPCWQFTREKSQECCMKKMA